MNFNRVGRIELEQGLVGINRLGGFPQFLRSARQILIGQWNQRIHSEKTFDVLDDCIPVFFLRRQFHQTRVSVQSGPVNRREFR